MATHKKPTAHKAPPQPLPKKAPPAPAATRPIKPDTNGKPAKNSPTMEKPSKKNALRDSILKRKTATKPIAFSLDEVRAIAKTVTSKTNSPFPAKTAKTAPAKSAVLEKSKPQHVKAASLADILGFNPKKTKTPDVLSDK